VSPEEIVQFANRYSNNARPVQPLNGREVLQAK
jgi:carbonic anhydrase